MKIKKAMVLLLFSMVLMLSFSYVPDTRPTKTITQKIALAAELQSSRLTTILEKISSRHEHVSQNIEELQGKGIDVTDYMKLSSLTQRYIDAAEQYIGLPLIRASAEKQFKNMNRHVRMTVHCLKKATVYLSTLQKSLINFYG